MFTGSNNFVLCRLPKRRTTYFLKIFLLWYPEYVNMSSSLPAIILKQSCMEGFRSCPSRSKNLAWGMSKSNFQSDFNLLWLKSQSNFQKECNQIMFDTWCSAPQQCQCCHRCLNQIWRRDTQTPDLKCFDKTNLKQKHFERPFAAKMANFRVPIIIIMRIGVGVTTWYLELGYFFHSLFEFLSIQSFLVKEVVPETKRWYLKQRNVTKTKRWYLKQRDGIWNKEVVFETKRWYLNQWKGGLQKAPPLEDSLEIIDIGEKVLEKSEAVSAACVRSQLVVPV